MSFQAPMRNVATVILCACLFAFGAASALAQARGGTGAGRGAAPAAQGRGEAGGGGGGNNPNPNAPTQKPEPSQLKEDAVNMQLVGFNDLQARSSYQPTIVQQGNRWIAYVGTHGEKPILNALTGKMEENGTMVLDVTDPKQPKMLAHIPGDPGRDPAGQGDGAQMVRVCSGATLPRADKSKTYMLRTYGSSAHETWDVTDPAKPVRLAVVVSGLRDTHKNFWECESGIAFLVSGAPDWRTPRMTQLYDLSDPAHPVFIRNFGLPGQQPGATGPVPTELHGAISLGPGTNRVYFGYGTSANGVIEIVDRQKLLNGPKEPTEANLMYPVIAKLELPPDIGSHTAFPLLGMYIEEFAKQKPRAATAIGEMVHDSEGLPAGPSQARRDYVISVGETTGNECQENRQMMHIIDITNEAHPFGVASWTAPEASRHFCDLGGRFGSHSVNENVTSFYHRRILFLSEFNAGVRALDIRDPLNPKEVGHYIPAVTDKTQNRCVGQGAAQKCKIAIQTNNAEVDNRGYIYIVDRANTGMHILQLTGSARAVANGLPPLN
jgi:hypothetical protein